MKQETKELLQEVQEILTTNFQTEVKIKSVESLSEETRRNLVLRIYLEVTSNKIPKTIIFKQSLIEKSSAQDDKLALGRFARDWAGLEFISGFDTQGDIAPKFYGGSIKSRFILLEDLGNHLSSLVEPLMGNDKSTAVNAINRYIVAMAGFHGNSHQHIQHYHPIIKKIFPNSESWQDGFEDMPAKIKSLLTKLNIKWSSELETEMLKVFRLVKEPGPFTALMHGDICPDNLVDYPEENKMKIIDFEWSYLGNCLLDSIYLRMYMPTCWCVMAFPEDVIEEYELAYRKELAKFIPLTKDDNVYYEYYVAACAYTIFWRLLNIEYVLDHEMNEDDLAKYVPKKWKAKYNIQRPRQLLRLEKFIEISKKHNSLPTIRFMAEEVLKELENRWIDVKPMKYYPAFR